jgi:hypothetical protein
MSVRAVAPSLSGDPKVVPVGERLGERVRFSPLSVIGA